MHFKSSPIHHRIVAVLIMLAIITSGCTSQSVNQPEDIAASAPEANQPVQPEQATSSEDVSEPTEEPVEQVAIRYQDWRLAEEPAGPSITSMVDQFMEANPNITVSLEPVASGDKEKVFITQVQGGDPPDVVRVVTHGAAPFFNMGALRNIEDFVAEEGGQAYKSQFTDYLVSAATFNGEMYCVPHEGDAFVLYINTRLWEEAGLDPENPPKTFDELHQANLALTNASENRYAMGLLGKPGSAPQWMQSWFLAFGSNLFNEDFTDTLIDTPEGIAAFKFYTDMYTVDKVVPPGPTEVGYGEQVALFAQEQVAYIQGPYATYGGILNANPDLEPYIKAIPFPGAQTYPGRTAGRGSVLCIPADAKHPAEAWQLIQWLVNDENQLAHFKDATMFPAKKSALDSIDYTELPVAKVIAEVAIPNAISYPTLIEWNEAKAVLEDTLANALLQEIDPETAMVQAATEIRSILGKE